MNFDESPPVAVSEYRRFQDTIPGIDALYVGMLAILQYQLPKAAPILIVGAGGGREIETLTASSHDFQLTGVDPSQDMLDVARQYIPSGAENRVRLVKGYVEDIAEDMKFYAATSILVMHFLPDDGAKKDYLDTIRSRLKPGAVYLHVDVSIVDDIEADNIGGVITAHGVSCGYSDIAVAGRAEVAKKMRAPGFNFIVSPDRNRSLMEQSGFEVVSMFFRTMWFTGWWARAV